MHSFEMNPILSVIVAVHNTSAYLEKCIESLLSQDFKDMEIICVNDASTDNSLEILNKYATCDERIVVIDLKDNVKLGGARNRGIDVANGHYLGFVDSDDYVSPYMYSSLISASNGITADIVTPICYANFTEKGSTICYQFPFAEQNEQFIPREVIQKHIVRSGCRIWASIFKTQYIRENNLRFAENVFYEDFPMFLSLFLRASTIRVLYNKEPLYYYRIDNDSSIIHGAFTKQKLEDRISGAILMYEDAQNLGICKTFSEELKYKMYCIFYYSTICLLLFKTEHYSSDAIRQVYKKYKLLMGKFPYNNPYYSRYGMRNILFRVIGIIPALGYLVRIAHTVLISRR